VTQDYQRNPVSLTGTDGNTETVVDNPVSMTGTGDNSETVVDDTSLRISICTSQ
jgi:hypothetical protein